MHIVFFSDPDNHNDWNVEPPFVSAEFDEFDYTFDFDEEDEPILEVLISESLADSFNDEIGSPSPMCSQCSP